MKSELEIRTKRNLINALIEDLEKQKFTFELKRDHALETEGDSASTFKPAAQTHAENVARCSKKIKQMKTMRDALTWVLKDAPLANVESLADANETVTTAERKTGWSRAGAENADSGDEPVLC